MKQRLMYSVSLFVCLTAAFAANSADFAESFEAETYPSIAPGGCQAERVKEHASNGEWALKVSFPGSQADTWPGLDVNLTGQAIDTKMILAFDVYNPSSEAVALSYRIDSADGKNTFGGESLKAEASTKVEIWLSSISDNVSVSQITRVFPYIRMPRKDYVLFFDNFRLEKSTDRFTRTGYLEIAKPLEQAPGAGAPRAVVFRRNELDHVFPNSLPWPGEPIERVRMFATRGEAEPLALSFRTLSEIKRAAVTISDLAYVGAAQWEASLNGTAGAVQEGKPLPAAAVEIGCVRYLNKKVTYSSADFYADMPTYVEAGNVFENLPANVTRTFWLRFRVPTDAAPGLYRGTVRIEFDDAKQELPITFTVLPFVLPEPKGYFIGEYYRPWDYKTDEEWKAGVTADLADMRDHGMTSVGVCFGFDTERVTFENGQFNLGLDGTTRFEHFLDTYVKLGFTAPVLLLADSGQDAAVKVGAYGTPEYDAAYKAYWTAIQTACKEHGWPELIVQPVDEPSWQGQEECDRNVHFLKLLKEIPGLRTEQDGPADAYFREVAGPYSDMWNYNGGIDEFAQVREIRKNHRVAFYNNDVESYRPEVDRYVAGFFTKAADIDGIFNWEYRGGSGSLYDDLDSNTGDFAHNYPATTVSKGGPSIAWETAREGVDDLRYLVLFDEWLGKTRAKDANSDAVKKADALRAYAFQSLQATPGVRSREQWSDAWSRAEAEAFAKDLAADTPKFVGGNLKQPNGWSLPDYQRVRWAVALSTVDLMAACGEAVTAPVGANAGNASVTLIGSTPYPERKRAAKDTDKVPPNTLDIRLADAFLESNDVLNVETEWMNERAPLDTSALRLRLLSGEQPIGEVVLPAPAPTRVRACLRVEHVTPGDYQVEAAVVGQDGASLATVKKACRVVSACHL